MTGLEETLKGYMKRQGLESDEALAAALSEATRVGFSGEGVRTVLKDPRKADAVFFYAAEIALGLEEDQTLAMMRIACADVEALRGEEVVSEFLSRSAAR